MDGAVEERLARPDALEQARVVAQHRVEDPETLRASGARRLATTRPTRGDLVADTRACASGVSGRGVEIAMGEVPEEVVRGADAEAGERVGPLLAHTLEELDRGVGAEGDGSAG